MGSPPPAEDGDFFEHRMKGRLYISKQFVNKFTGKRQRFVHKVTESDEQSVFVKVKDEVFLSRRHGERHQLKALLIEDPRSIHELVIQTFTSGTGSPHKDGYSFRNDEVRSLYDFLRGLYEKDLSTEGRILIDDSALDAVLLSPDQASRLVTENEELVAHALRNNVTKKDILAVGYRKEQLSILERLIEDDGYFADRKASLQARGDEAVWQHFLEANPWIMGYGLTYVVNAPLEGQRLEQIVSGATVFERGKRTDALLRTQGIVSSLCFGEIKTHKTPLLRRVKDSYRGESWSISEELSGAIAQVQRTVQRSIENIRTRTDLKDEGDNPTGDSVYLYRPRSFIVAGSLSEFVSENGVNEMKFSSFEMFRRSIHDIEILTFDELARRAAYIVTSAEQER